MPKTESGGVVAASRDGVNSIHGPLDIDQMIALLALRPT